MERCFSAIAIKGFDEEQRTIFGVASTPEPDRIGDIVEPLGLKYRNPVSLLWQHRHDSPVGSCSFDRPTKSGVTFTATMPKVSEPGTFRDQVDHAWHAVRHGACRAVSIGFRSIEHEPLPGGGLRFVKAELLELSLVSVPANPGATITEVRAFDAALRRGETPSAPQANALWREIAAAGERAIVETRGLPSYARSTASMKMAAEARSCGMEMTKALAERIETLERQLAESAVEYKGVWSPGQQYRRGQLITHGGNIWHCNQPTTSKPGEAHADWTLAVRRGKDGRDAR